MADVLYVTNRPSDGIVLSDLAVPGPISWGATTCAVAAGEDEGFAWKSTKAKPNLGAIDEAAFLQALSAKLVPGDKPKAVLIHLHGAGCMSAGSFCRAANLAKLYGGADLDIVPVLVSWACGSFAVSDYLDARRWLQRDVADLARAFRSIATTVQQAQSDGDGRLTTILSAHSLGNYLLSRILADTAARPDLEPLGVDAPFDDVMLLAADVDQNALDEDHPPAGGGLQRLGLWCRGIHVYSSHSDSIVGLGWLGQVALPIPGRSGVALGMSGPRPSLAQMQDGTPVDAVSCGFLPGAMAGESQHHYWRLDPVAIGDIKAVIRGVPVSKMTWRTRNLFDPHWDLLPDTMPPPRA